MDSLALVEAVQYAYDLDDMSLRGEYLATIRIRAAEIKATQPIAEIIKWNNQALKAAGRRHQKKIDSNLKLIVDADGRIKDTGENYFRIMSYDPNYAGFRYNEMKNAAEIKRDKEHKQWSDADYAISRHYIEETYGIYNTQKHDDAIRRLMKAKTFNPAQEMVDGIQWDGENRCEHFLTKWAKADDTPYTREVSRLIFAGGINRLYHPGCKFDDVPVLIGTHQGEGKSSLISFLAIDQEFYCDSISEVDGAKAVEQLDGAWICEIAELLALTKQKEQEASKAYITRTHDKYRVPYGKTVELRPRRCIFIGSTNNRKFLRDQTGNRRFYPVVVHSNGYEIWNQKDEIIEYIKQCWAEAKVRMERDEMPAFADKDLTDAFREEQASAMEEDYRVGLIDHYLATKQVGDYVCSFELMSKALNCGSDYIQKPTKKESAEIGLIMQGFYDWEECGSHRFSDYGKQRAWKRIRRTESGAGECSASADESIPF